jgi:hypothetical protein
MPVDMVHYIETVQHTNFEQQATICSDGARWRLLNFDTIHIYLRDAITICRAGRS